MGQPETPAPPRVQNSLYIQLALYACGNALAIVIGLILYNLWAVLSDFRDPMLFALLCSIALRGPKDWLMQHMEARLAQDRSVVWSLMSVLGLPLMAVRETYEEGKDLLLKWRQNVAEYQAELQRRQMVRRISGNMSTPPAPGTPTTPRSPTSPTSPVTLTRQTSAPREAVAAAAASAMHTLPVLLSVYAKAGVKALRTRRTNKKRRKKAAALRAAVPSAVLFRWLFRACVAWLVYEWVQAVWSATLQLAVLVTTVVLGVGCIPLMYLSAHWYLGSSLFSPLKTPLGGLSTQGRGFGTPPTSRGKLTPPPRPRFTPASQKASAQRTQRSGSLKSLKATEGSSASLKALLLETEEGATQRGSNGSAGGSAGPRGQSASRWQAVWAAGCSFLGDAAEGCTSLLCALDAGLRSVLRRNLHAIVSLLLIMGLLLGSTGLATFLTVQVVQEGRDSVLAVRDMFPTAWAGVAISSPATLPATATPAAPSPDWGPPQANASMRAEAGGSAEGGACASGDPWEWLAASDSGAVQQCAVSSDAAGATAAAAGAPASHLPASQPAAEAAAAAAAKRGSRLSGTWLAPYQLEAQGLIQRSLPGIAAWVEGRFNAFMARHNLTAAAGDLRLLYETIHGPRQCSAKERGQLLVAVARANLGLRSALEREGEAQTQVERLKQRLVSAVRRLAELRSAASHLDHSSAEDAASAGTAADAVAGTSGAPAASSKPHRQSGQGQQFEAMLQEVAGSRPTAGAQVHEPAMAAGGAGAGAGGPATGAAGLVHSSIQGVEEELVAADAQLTAAKLARKAASEAVGAAQREVQAAEGRLQLCRSEEGQGAEAGSGGHPVLPGLAGDVGRRLQSAYIRLWHRQFQQGWAEMRGAAQLCIDALRNATAHHQTAHHHQQHAGPVSSGPLGAAASTGGHHHHHQSAAAASVADLGSLQRLLLAAADPLISAGRALAGVFALSVGSTTAAAVMGGLGVLRLGLGLAKFGMQFTLFLALLYYLLAAQREPLVHAVGVLPLSEGGKQRAAAAFNKALGGVFVSSVKLVAFHGAFTWLTFRMFAMPLAYTATVACSACALLPFIPTYVIALPATAMLAAQGRLVSGLLFFVLHFGAYYLGDTLILEDIPGSHPYLMSLGILGGIYTFDNPLQGCLLGPILLSLLTVFYNLHSEFMGGGLTGDSAAWAALRGSGARKHHHHHHHGHKVVISSPVVHSPFATVAGGSVAPWLAGHVGGSLSATTSPSTPGPVGVPSSSEGGAEPPAASPQQAGQQQQQQQQQQQGSAPRPAGGSPDGDPQQSISLSLGMRRRCGAAAEEEQEEEEGDVAESRPQQQPQAAAAPPSQLQRQRFAPLLQLDTNHEFTFSI